MSWLVRQPLEAKSFIESAGGVVLRVNNDRKSGDLGALPEWATQSMGEEKSTESVPLQGSTDGHPAQ